MLAQFLSQISTRLTREKISIPFSKCWAKISAYRLSSGHAAGDDLEGLPERLQAFSEALAKVSCQAEPEFLQLGRQLQSAYADASALAQDTVATVKQLGGESDTGMLNQIDRLVHAALTELRSRKERVSTDLDCLAQGAGYMGDLNKQCTVVEKMALVLRVVGLNIGIESSRSAEAREMFGVVAADVRKLADTIIGNAADIRNDAQSAQSLQDSAHKEISQGINELNAVAADAEQAVADAAGEIKALMVLSLGAMDRAGVFFNEISQQVGEVVVGIQFHDNMNQRINHINEALADVALLCNPADAGNRSEKERNAQLERAHALVALQIAQLTQVISEIHDVHTQNTDAFDAIIERVEKLAQNLTIFDTGSTPKQIPDQIPDQTSGLIPDQTRDQSQITNRTAAHASGVSEDLFLNLKSALKRFRDLLDQSGKLHARMQATFDQAGTAIARLSDSAAKIRRINFQIHIIALNAIVKSAHMDINGRALEVLAQTVKDLSDQSNTFVVRVNTILDGISSTAGARSGMNAQDDAVEISTDTSDSAMDEGIMQITHAYEQLHTDSADITQRAGTLKQALFSTRNGLDFLKALVQRLTRHLEGLTAIGKLLPAGADQGITDSLADDQNLAARYTMERERIIHEGQLDAGGDSGAGSTTVFGRESDDDSDTNVDRFASAVDPQDTHIDPAAIRPPNTDGKLKDDNCELFGTEEIASARDVAARKAKDENDLGDNIDLF